MKFIGTIFVRRFDAGDGFVVEIVDEKVDEKIGRASFRSESWLYYKDYGDKKYMFGATLQEFARNGASMEAMVDASLGIYKQLYINGVIKGGENK